MQTFQLNPVSDYLKCFSFSNACKRCPDARIGCADGCNRADDLNDLFLVAESLDSSVVDPAESFLEQLQVKFFDCFHNDTICRKNSACDFKLICPIGCH